MRIDGKPHLNNSVDVMKDAKINSIFVIKNKDGTDKVILMGVLRETDEIIKITYPRAVTTLNFDSIYASKDLKAEFFSVKILPKCKKPTLWKRIKNFFAC